MTFTSLFFFLIVMSNLIVNVFFRLWYILPWTPCEGDEKEEKEEKEERWKRRKGEISTP